MTEAIRILIAADHAVVREGLRGLIATEPGMVVIAEAVDGPDAVSKAGSLRPDVILMDLVMPHLDGLEAIHQIKERDPEARILVLTSFAGDDKVFPAIRNGALGYLLKDTSPQELLHAIRDVYRGESSLHPTIARMLIGELNRPPTRRPAADQLTEREVDVLQLVALGLSNEVIGARLFISERTVRTHVSSLLGKLHLANRTQAALYAVREGFASLDGDD